MTPEDTIRGALEQGLLRFTGRLNTEETRTEITALLESFAAATPKPAIEVDFSDDGARISARSLRGTVVVRYPSTSNTLVAWANAGVLADPEALGLALYEVDGKRFWRWLGAP